VTPPRRHRYLLAAAIAATFLAATAAAQEAAAPRPALAAFTEVVPTEGRSAVHLAVAQVVRVGRAEGHTVLDTAAWVQQRTVEPIEAVARRLRAAGQHLVALTDLGGARIYLAADRVVLVRDSGERHAAGARAAIVMVGLRFNPDVAVRETVEEVMAALRREAQGAQEAPAAAPRPGGGGG